MTRGPRQSLDPRAVWFSLFNFVIFLAVFMGRILRDSLLFSQEKGEVFFPAALVVNAILITYVGSHLESLQKKWKTRKLFARAFLGSALLFCAFGTLFWLNQKVAPQWPWIPPWLPATALTFLFFIASEIPIFLAMNLIWLISPMYFGEQEGHEYFPDISAIGLLGIAVSSMVVLGTLWSDTLELYHLIFVWGALSALLWGIGRGIEKYCSKYDSIAEDPVDDDSVHKSENRVALLPKLRDEVKWALEKEPLVWTFIIVTVSNFVLLAIFDQILANGAAHLEKSGQEIAMFLATATLAFGLFGAVFQRFGFKLMLKRMTPARLNMYAPVFMMLGAFCYVVVPSGWLRPIWNSVGFETGQYLFLFLVIARMAGWTAEYLFNQSMLPLVYGSLPTRTGSRARLLIEGPVTAITNGSVGLFLLGYFFLFALKGDSLSAPKGELGYQMDILYAIALLAAVAMLYFSKQMIRHFTPALERRAKEGEIPKEILEAYHLDLEGSGDLIMEELEVSGKNGIRFPRQLAMLRDSLGSKAIRPMEEYARDRNLAPKNRAEAMKGLIELEALESLEHIIDWAAELTHAPSKEEIEALGAAGHEVGHTAKMAKIFGRWLHSTETTLPQYRALMGQLSELKFEGNRIIHDFLESQKHLWEKDGNSLEDKHLELVRGILGTACHVAGSAYYPQFARLCRRHPPSDWSTVGEFDFSNHESNIDALGLLLGHTQTPEDTAARAIEKLMLKHQWLCWILLWLMEAEPDQVPEEVKEGRCVWPIVVARTLRQRDLENGKMILPANTLAFLRHLQDESYPLELRSLNSAEFEEPAVQRWLQRTDFDATKGIDIVDYLLRTIRITENMSTDVGYYEACCEGLYALLKKAPDGVKLDEPQMQVREQFKLMMVLWNLFQSAEDLPDSLFRSRATQWLNVYLMLLACEWPQMRDDITRATAGYLLSGESGKPGTVGELDRRSRDDALSVMEQHLPHPVYSKLREDIDMRRLNERAYEERERIFGARIATPHHPQEARKAWETVASKVNDPVLIELVHAAIGR